MCFEIWYLKYVVVNFVEINNISKSYGTHKALLETSFSVKKGELFGVIGPDGAGKTTLFRILYWKRDKFIHFIVHYYYFGLKPWIALFYFIHDLKVVAIHIVQFYPFRSIVYAIKIKVKNDGSIKIGMPGEMKFGN